MRIRRRPQAQALSSPPPSDPSTAPRPPPAASRSQAHWPPGGKDDEEELHLHPNAAGAGAGDSSAARLAALPFLPQGDVVERSRSLGGAQPPPQREGAAGADGHRSLENGHHDDKYSESAIKTGERLANGFPAATPVATVAVNVKEEAKNGSNGGVKKRRGPAVLKEGSRCSRVNGRGWRCSQPTLVGYCLCEHHLGKGRMRSVSVSGGGGRGGAGQLGRTEPRKHAAPVAAPAKADELRPSVTNC